MVYAKNADDFEGKMVEWEKIIEGVQIKLGTGERAKIVELSQYWLKNWKPDIPMWARYERKSLPLGQEHTTNRCVHILLRRLNKHIQKM